VTSLDPNATKPLDLNGVFWIASMTKLMTTISAMQCVERGLIDLDDDVSDVLHELKGAEVLEGFDNEGKPKLRKAKNKITLRWATLIIL
jgi:CubicO group peptidase (beta-lactamase class C family)